MQLVMFFNNTLLELKGYNFLKTVIYDLILFNQNYKKDCIMRNLRTIIF